MQGDKLASGARTATFSVAPGLKFDEQKMRDDLGKLPKAAFIDKYMVAELEYQMLSEARVSDDEVKISDFAKDMATRTEFYNRELALDEKQVAQLNRECFLEPFVPIGCTGRVIVSQDTPTRQRTIVVQAPRSKRTEKELLPTTGHIIKAIIYDSQGVEIGESFINKRVVFNPMSGSALCFNGFPIWRQLELSEILAYIHREDVQLVEEVLEPMV